MSKRRSNDEDLYEKFLPSKRLAINASTAACATASTQVDEAGCGSSQAVAAHSLSAVSALTQESTMEVWLEVAAQVQDALAALPGWIQIAQAVQFDNPEHLSSLSSASTPMPALFRDSADCGSWPVQASTAPHDVRCLTELGLRHARFSPKAPAAACTPVAEVAPTVPHDLSSQPAPAPAALPLDSSTSDSDTAAACGWFSKCRGCCQLTAGEVELQGQVVPLCRGCSSCLHRRPASEREQVVQRVMRSHAALCQREFTSGGAS